MYIEFAHYKMKLLLLLLLLLVVVVVVVVVLKLMKEFEFKNLTMLYQTTRVQITKQHL